MTAPGQSSMEKRNILVVDDARVSRTILAKILCEAGYEVCTAASGRQAMAMLEGRDIHGFMLDIGLPDMTGIDLCQRLRSLPAYRMTPILFVTAMDEHLSLDEAFAAGGDDFISKPVNAVVLKARLANLIQKADLFNQLARVRQNLGRYISPRTQKMVEIYSESGILPPPVKRDVCVLFCDIRGYTALAQEIDPEVLFATLSTQLGAQVDIVYRRGGYIDKFAGDGVMAVFDGRSMALSSCLCALEIVGHSGKTFPPGTRRPLPLGIGIHAGPAVIGNIGSEDHLDYSAVGNTVNLAARLCGHAEPMSIIVSSAVRQAVGEDSRVQFSDEEEVRLRGIKLPVTLYNVTRGGP